MFRNGVVIIVEPGNFHNQMKNLNEEREHLCQWETMNYMRMKYKELINSLVLVICQEKYHEERRRAKGKTLPLNSKRWN